MPVNLKGITMNYFNYLDSTGYELVRDLPEDCIAECSASGSVDSAIAYWKDKLGFDAPIGSTKAYLASIGSWETSDLQDHETNLERLLWLVCCDIKEYEVNQ